MYRTFISQLFALQKFLKVRAAKRRPNAPARGKLRPGRVGPGVAARRGRAVLISTLKTAMSGECRPIHRVTSVGCRRDHNV